MFLFMVEEKISLLRKIIDYTLFGSGIGATIDGAVRIANNSPEYIWSWNNLDNGQLQFGYLLTTLGGISIAYGIERIVKYSKG